MPHSDEVLDVLDATGAVLGTASRSQVHNQGLWHAVFHCQIVAVRGDTPTLVLQRRHPSKLAFGGLLDVSAAGHLTSGEQPTDGVRELAEELGVKVEPSQLVSLGERRLVDNTGEGHLNMELTHVFLLRDDRKLGEYQLAAGEVDAVFEAPASALLALFAGQTRSVELTGCTAAGSATRETFSLADFVPDFDYWITLTVMSERFGLDITPVAI